MNIIKILLHESRGVLLLALLMSILSGACSTALLALLNVGIFGDRESDVRFIWSFLALCILAPGSYLLSRYTLQRLTQGAILRLRMKLGQRILATPLRRLEDIGVPRFLAALTDDINTVGTALSNMPMLCVHGAVVVGCMSYLAFLSIPLFITLLVAFSLGIVGYRLPMAAGLRRFEASRTIQDKMYQYFQGLLHGIKELKLHHSRSAAFFASLERTADTQRRHRISANVIYGLGTAWGRTVLFFVLGGLMVSRSLLGNIDTVTMASYALVLIYVMTPMQLLLNMMPQLAQARVAVGKIERLGLQLEEPRSVARSWNSSTTHQQWNELKLVGASIEYSADNPCDAFSLGPIDLVLRNGELIFLVGGNGSGKTTLAKVLLGLYQLDSGEILLDGSKVTDDDIDGYHTLFSTVFSDFYLFEELLGLEHDDLSEKADYYLRKLQIDDKVKIEDGVFSTLSLSQGQRKRLALLVAYLEDRSIFVFDEWAADQDPAFKEVFYHDLLPDLKRNGKTVVVISHDDRHYSVADRIVKLDDGKIVYDGPASRFSLLVGENSTQLTRDGSSKEAMEISTAQ